MSGQSKVQTLSMRRLVQRLRDDLRDTSNGGRDFVLLYAYNGTGKTRLSMEFKEAGKRKNNIERDTLYFNAFTEDLFHWDNDLDGDVNRRIVLNTDSHFFDGLSELEMDNRIRPLLNRYADFNFKIRNEIKDEREITFVSFERDVLVNGKLETIENIKISRGEENIFIWCFFLAFAQLAIDQEENSVYSWVKYIYIDDPISSLDDNNAIAVASDLAQLLKKGRKKIKTVISSHHGLFFNVMCNELKKFEPKLYFFHRSNDADRYTIQATDDTPFFHHVALLSELQQASTSGKLYTHHFNALRNILEKTATFFGYDDFSACLDDEDEALHARALNLLSHGGYSVYEPREMMADNKALFNDILSSFLQRYQFQLPEIFAEQTTQSSNT